VPNCELGHHGEDVSFNSILKKYDLTDPALRLLARLCGLPIRIRRNHIPRVKVCVGWRTVSVHLA
jgi:hypothetical protein